MPVPDPNNKNIVNSTDENNYDADDKVTNTGPVREGQEDSSILEDKGDKGDAAYVKLTEYDNHPREQEEFVDDDKQNLIPED